MANVGSWLLSLIVKTEGAREAAQDMDKMRGEVSKIEPALKKTSREMEDFKRASKDAADQAKRGMEETKRAVEQTASSVRRMPGSFSSMGASIARARNEAEQLSRATKPLPGSFANIGRGIAQARSEADNFTRSARGMSGILANLKNGFNGLVSKLKEMTGLSGGSLLKLATGLGLLAVAFKGAQIAAEAFGNAIRTGIQKAAIQESALNRLGVSFQAIGQYSRKSVKDFEAWAGQVQRASKYGDDAIIQTAAVIAQFGRITGQKLKDATQGAIDFSAATGRDLRTSALLLAKAAQGVTGELTRYGLIVDANIPKSEKFSETIRLLKENFGGTAAGEVATFSGAVEQLKNAFGDALEVFGQPFIVLAERIFPRITDALLDFREKFGNVFADIVPQTSEQAFDRMEAAATQTFRGMIIRLTNFRDEAVTGFQDAKIQLQLEIRKGDIQTAKDALVDIRKRMDEAAREGDYRLFQIFQKLDSYAQKEFKIRLDLETAKAEQAFEDIVNLIQRPVDAKVQFDILNTAEVLAFYDSIREIEAQLIPKPPEPSQFKQLLEKQTIDVDFASALQDANIPPIEVDVELKSKPIPYDLEKELLSETEIEIQRVQTASLENFMNSLKGKKAELEDIVAIRSKIEAEVQFMDADELLETKNELIEKLLSVDVMTDSGRQVAKELREVIYLFSQLAQERVEVLIELKGQDKVEAVRKQIADLRKQATGQVSLVTDEDLRKSENLTEELKRFRAEVLATIAAGEAKESKSAFDKYYETLKQMMEDVPELREEIQALIDEASGDIKATVQLQVDNDQAMKKLEETDKELTKQVTEKSRRIKMLIELERYDQVIAELEALQALIEKYPDKIEFEVELKKLQESLNKAREQTNKEAGGMEAALDELNKMTFDALKETWFDILDDMRVDTDNFADAMVKIFAEMARQMIYELAKVNDETRKLTITGEGISFNPLAWFKRTPSSTGDEFASAGADSTGIGNKPIFEKTAVDDLVSELRRGGTLRLTPVDLSSYLPNGRATGDINLNLSLNETQTLQRSLKSGAFRDALRRESIFIRG